MGRNPVTNCTTCIHATGMPANPCWLLFLGGPPGLSAQESADRARRVTQWRERYRVTRHLEALDQSVQGCPDWRSGQIPPGPGGTGPEEPGL